MNIAPNQIVDTSIQAVRASLIVDIVELEAHDGEDLLTALRTAKHYRDLVALIDSSLEKTA